MFSGDALCEVHAVFVLFLWVEVKRVHSILRRKVFAEIRLVSENALDVFFVFVESCDIASLCF